MREGPSAWAWFGRAVILILAITAAVLGAVVLVGQLAIANAVERQAEEYTPPPLAKPEPVVSIIGDSYSAGSDQNHGQSTLWWSLLSKKDQFSVQNLTLGGSGWVTISSIDASQGTFQTRAQRVATYANVVVFFGSRNDTDSVGSADEVATAARNSLATVKRLDPTAKILVIGPPWVNSQTPGYITARRNALKSVANAAGATWIDPVAGSWFPTGAKGLIGSDDVHPTDEGHQLMAQKIGPTLKALIAESVR